MNLQESSFEELFNKLEDTVAALERGGLPLEEALGMFEQGVLLAKECQGRLENAELRIREIKSVLTEDQDDG